MSSTKIFVLRLKEVIYTALFAILGLILLIVLIFMFIPNKKGDTALYKEGVYTAPITLDYASFNVSVVVEDDKITSVELTDFNEDMATMYPLIEPTMAYLNKQITKKQSLEIEAPEDSVHTTKLLLDGIKAALNNKD
ncbi:hypothetical protein GND95_07010 [Defluviitalea raffinosedens]|uniref:FMN-binding protein n=1 Tax=Defluviitalea raffinosedens TaxID=1450156 RepID=A0A7C8HGP7_9FIRM|nr:hypothetical protein [Defluviitalea raffinosedens]KAE9634414.1 hypothetical protein GND95_07010 [Defluviitalea raffinosedens]HHW67029.1 hypothetical protein [Candidatus Epulonipiscium sp.]